jgi:hypothetical protein
MGFLESVGLLAVIILSLAIAVYFTIGADQYVEGNKELIECSEKCQLLIEQSRAESINGIRSLSGTQLNRKIRRILKDPVEFQKAQDKLKQKREFEAQRNLERRNNRKIGFKYDTAIFEIFSTRRSLRENELIAKIKTKLRVDDIEARNIFKIWHDHNLITYKYDRPDEWEVGLILIADCYKIDPGDITRTDWLQQNGLNLDPE